MKPLGLYIHVPFCVSRCHYCDFYSTTDLRVENIARYVKATKKALTGWGSQLADHRIATIYFGGGTPGLLGDHLCELMTCVRDAFEVSDGAEVSVEVNPTNLDSETLARWIDSGVGRISLGVQSFDERVLKVLGRSHTSSDTMKALAILDEADVSVSLDLICGVPHLGFEGWRAQIEMAIACDPDHISIYPLTVEEKTPLHELAENGEISMPDEDEVADQMILSETMLSDAGYVHYEVSNYSKDGKCSRHNTSYWTSVPYLGIGPQAASMRNELNGSRKRMVMHSTLEDYTNEPVRLTEEEWMECETLTPSEAICEDIMLGMRLLKGVEEKKVQITGLDTVFEELVMSGLVTLDHDTERYVPTQRGWLLGNEVYSAIWNSSKRS
ncbi:MAG: radical SAM family heme chaperone HemW [Actinomycetia bacterium]|nr:radical SAM family heme chaperone HemW [Actinomycetes bacterium]